MRRKGKAMYQRDSVEQFRGKPFTDEEAIVALPENGEDLDIRPRIAEQKWELPVMKGLKTQQARMIADPEIQYFVREARTLMFGSDKAPFETLDDAASWIAQELVNREEARKRLDDLRRKLQKEHPELLISIPLVWVPAHKSFLPIANILGFSSFGRENVHSLIQPFEAPSEVSFVATTEKLRILAYETDVLARFAVWTLGQCTALVLCGKVPPTPRFRIWKNPLGTRAIIDCSGTINRREVLELYRIMRESSGTARTKSFTVEDLDLIKFVEVHHHMTWPERLKKWNKGYPSKRYTVESSLQNAYKRAKGREDRP